MRILFDAHILGSQETGNETYLKNLLQHIPSDTQDTIYAAKSADYSPSQDFQGSPLNWLPLPSANDWLRLLNGLPKLVKEVQADTLHVTYIGPFIKPCPLVVTVHDVSYRRYPEFFSPRDRLLLNTLLPYSMLQADRIVTVSEHAKAEIIHYYPFTASKISAIYEAADVKYHILAADTPLLNQVRQKYGIEGDFILAVGNLQPRKNIQRLVEAFVPLLADYPQLKLVVVGKAAWQASAISSFVKASGAEAQIIFTGYAPDEDLLALYNMAKIFIYPSLYEGFGLPILEAMACGTAVITSNITSMPEVAGDAAILIDPYDVGAMQGALRQILTDDSYRQSLITRGLAQCQQFTWERCSAETLQVHYDLAAHTGNKAVQRN